MSPVKSGSLTFRRGIIRSRVPLQSARMKTLLTKLKSVQGLDSGPLCRHVQPYIAQAHEQGYKLKTIRYHLRLMANFNRWLVRTGRGLRDLNEKTIDAFLRRFLGQRTWRAGERLALFRMLCILRKTRATPQAKAVQLNPAQALAVQYREYLTKERGCTDWTVDHYGRHIDRFLAQRFGAGPVRFERLRAQDVIAFVQLEAGRHGRGYILQVATGLRSFFRFLRYRGDITTDLATAVPSVANWPKTDLPKHLPADAVQRVLDGCDLTTAVGRRDYAILLLLARLGLRAGEVVTLQLEDIDWDNGQITVRSKKGRGWARLPLPRDVGKAISRYLRLDRPRCSCRNVFVCMVAPYRRFSGSYVVSDLTRNALQRAGVESVRKGAHLFRHSLATAMLRQGASLDEIGQVLRHKDPDTTAIYANVDLDALRRVAVAWPGGGL
jgi:site-specific recombinase XerD